MNFIEKRLKEVLTKAIYDSYQHNVDDNILMIEIPKDENNGDYSTNIAMRLTKVLKQRPLDIANSLKANLINDEIIKDVVVAGPGFINFYIEPSFIADCINYIIDLNEQYGVGTNQNKSILFEYVSANPTGKLHVGHARGAVWGDACTRLLKNAGFNVGREYYVNDGGNQIKNLGLSLYARYRELNGLDFELSDDGYHGKDIIEIAKRIKEEYQDHWINETNQREQFFINEGIKQQLDQIKLDLNYLRVDFDSWFSENSLYQSDVIENVIKLLGDNGYTYQSEGALWFKSTEFGDDKDRVLIKSDGSYTYLTPDIAYHLNKLMRKYDILVDLLGADHHGYINRMKAAIAALGYQKEQLEIDIIQMVRIIENGQEVKMSKRTGNAITIRELCDDIGVDATRYFILQRSIESHLDFDLTLARSTSNENPVYYIQYAYARICSIEKQAMTYHKQDSYHLLNESIIIQLMKHLIEYEKVVNDAAINRTPNKLCNYIYKLATYFHSFYTNCKINDINNIELSIQRLNLLLSIKIVLNNSFSLIGIQSLEEMTQED